MGAYLRPGLRVQVDSDVGRRRCGILVLQLLNLRRRPRLYISPLSLKAAPLCIAPLAACIHALGRQEEGGSEGEETGKKQERGKEGE